MEAAGREDEQQRKDQSDAHASFYGDSGHTGTRRSAPRYDRCAITRGERLSLTRGTEAFPHSRHGAAFAVSHSPRLRGEGTKVENATTKARERDGAAITRDEGTVSFRARRLVLHRGHGTALEITNWPC